MRHKLFHLQPQARSLTEGIRLQREALRKFFSEPMHNLAIACSKTATNGQMHSDQLHTLLTDALPGFEHCKHLFVLDQQFIQITSNITRQGPDKKHFGRDRRDRPYTANITENSEFKLSPAYISHNTHRPSLTMIQAIRDTHHHLLGYLGADFDMRELPHTQQCYREPDNWHQLKGDPVIRRSLFAQQRIESIMDDNIDDALDTIHELMTNCGVYHADIQFSRSRATVWHQDDPYTYHMLTLNELTAPDILLAFPQHRYFERAEVPIDRIKPVFDMFKQLRFADENIYLRSASLNIVNAMTLLNFSCDGTHYMRYDEFLEKDIDFWFGKLHQPNGFH